MTPGSVWDVLGIAPTNDRDLIRKAYTRKLKVTNPEDDPAGFQHLRQAYEVALRFVGHAVAFEELEVEDEPEAVADFRPPEPLGRIATHDAVVPQSVLEVHEDYRKLSELVEREGSSAAALQLFSKMCADPALEAVSLRIDLETYIAALLLRHMPKSSELMLRAAHAFGWSTQRSRIGTASVIVAAAECAESLRYVDQLRRGAHELSMAFRALMNPPVGWLLRVKILLFGLDEKVTALLHALRVERVSAGAVCDPAATAWWDAYFAKPRLSRAMVILSLVVPLFLGWITSVKLTWALLIMVAATVGKLFLIDWGRIRFQARFVQGMPAWIEFGWLPLAALLAIVAALGPALWPVSALCVLWAWYSRPELQPWQNLRSLPLLIYINLPLIVWLCFLAAVLRWPVALAIAGLAAAHVTGQVTLAHGWLRLSPTVRIKGVAALLSVTIALAVTLIMRADDQELYGLFAALAMVVVVLQRTAIEVLTESQLKARYYVSFAGVFIVMIGLANLDAAGMAVVATSAFFLFTSAVGLVMMLVSERRRAIASRLDP